MVSMQSELAKLEGTAARPAASSLAMRASSAASMPVEAVNGNLGREQYRRSGDPVAAHRMQEPGR